MKFFTRVGLAGVVAALLLTAGNGWAVSQTSPSQSSAPKQTEKKVDRAALRESVRQAFESRQTQLRQELTEFQARLNRLAQTLDERERFKNEIIDHRVEELLNPHVNWDAPDELFGQNDKGSGGTTNDPNLFRNIRRTTTPVNSTPSTGADYATTASDTVAPEP